MAATQEQWEKVVSTTRESAVALLELRALLTTQGATLRGIYDQAPADQRPKLSPAFTDLLSGEHVRLIDLTLAGLGHAHHFATRAGAEPAAPIDFEVACGWNPHVSGEISLLPVKGPEWLEAAWRAHFDELLPVVKETAQRCAAALRDAGDPTFERTADDLLEITARVVGPLPGSSEPG